MFREMRRFKQQLSMEESKSLLCCEPRGILSVHGDDDYPYGLPMDFCFDETRNCIYFHSALEGHKIDAVKRNPKVSFCVFDSGYRKEGEWFLNIKSVIVFGKLHIVEDPERFTQMLRAIGQKYYPAEHSVEDVINKYKANVQILELTIEHISGKLVREK